MMRRAVITVAFAVLLSASIRGFCEDDASAGAAPVTGAGEEPLPGEAGSPEAKAAMPDFKKEEGSAAFNEGQSLFTAGKFKEAAAAFNKAHRDARGKADRDAVDAWIQACKEGQQVDKLKLLAEKNKLHDAYKLGEELLKKNRGKPAAGVFQKFLDELSKRLFVMLEAFENPNAQYSEKYGKTFVRDAKVVFQGAQCLRWTNTPDRKVAMLKVEGVPRNWNDFEAVELWVRVASAPAGCEGVIVCGAEGRKKDARKPTGQAQDFFVQTVPFGQTTGEWQRVRLPMTGFQARGGADLASVQDFRLQVPAGRQFDIYLDSIVAVRKDPEPAGAAKGKGKGPSGSGK